MTPSEFCVSDSHKTKMIRLRCGEETTTWYVKPFRQNTRTWRTDRQTDGQADGRTDGRTELLYQYRASPCVLTRDKNDTRYRLDRDYIGRHQKCHKFRPSWKTPPCKKKLSPWHFDRVTMGVAHLSPPEIPPWKVLREISAASFLPREKLTLSKNSLFVKFMLAASSTNHHRCPVCFLLLYAVKTFPVKNTPAQFIVATGTYTRGVHNTCGI